MHRLAAMPGGWESGDTPEGVIFIEQSTAPVVMLTAADTDIQVLARTLPQLPSEFPAVRVVNLLQLQQQLTIDTYADEVLGYAQVIILRLLGGRAYWSYGLEVVKETVTRTGANLFVLPGDDRPDPDLVSHSTVPLSVADQLWRYFTEGGVDNCLHALKFVAHQCLEFDCSVVPPQVIPRIGVVESSLNPPILGNFDLQNPPVLGGRGANAELDGTPQIPARDTDLKSLCPLPPAASPASPSSSPFPPPLPPKIGILFYRAHYLAGNTDVIDALCTALQNRGLEAVPVFAQSLQDPGIQAELVQLLQPSPDRGIDLLLNTTSFSLAKLASETLNLQVWQQLDVPVLQVICSGGTVERWQTHWKGLTPRDLAMNVALPEVDGRIISRAVSFKAVQTRNDALETEVIHYQPVGDRIDFVADLAANWVKLRRTPVTARRIGLILANYPTRDGRLANGVGLDTPASCVEILRALQQAGYQVERTPANGDELIQGLTTGVTNDPEVRDLRRVYQRVSVADYRQYFQTLPQGVREQVCDRWGDPDPYAPDGYFAIAGLQLGHVFVGIQPARGYDIDPSLNYHAPDLEPTHAYLAFYYWLRHQFKTQAVVHVGKHGNLEWLPGKSAALSEACFPEVALGPLPHLYPFIVNDPGEGAQAKRRAQAVIIDHLTPPLTRAELYGPLQQLEALIDEYYEAQSLDPSRVPVIRDRIVTLVEQENLHRDLGVALSSEPKRSFPLEEFLSTADGYLCELKEAQIRDGLHIFGQCPQGQQLRDLVVSLARHPSRSHRGLTRTLAEAWGLDFDPLTAVPATPLSEAQKSILRERFCPPGPPILGGESCNAGAVPSDLEITGEICLHTHQGPAALTPSPSPNSGRGEPEPVQASSFSPLSQDWERGAGGGRTSGASNLHIIGDAIELLEHEAAELIDQLIHSSSPNSITHHSKLITQNSPPPIPNSALHQELTWIKDHLLPPLYQTDQELTNLLRGLEGRYVPSGASGAPTRGRPEVLPTGRNFYSVDIRALPTESAWDVGRKAAEILIERYTQEQGEYPCTLGLSVWGTATMRTGGDDIAEALALLGVQPVWEGLSRRVIDFEILPLSVLGRPRVDVTLRISGFFRDAFANLIDLFDRAVTAVASLDEPPDQNPLAAQVRSEVQHWQSLGLSETEALARSRYRIFGSKPGAYGAGLQGLIDAQNWQDDSDLAQAYINWSSYAYTAQPQEDSYGSVQANRSDSSPPILGATGSGSGPPGPPILGGNLQSPPGYNPVGHSSKGALGDPTDLAAECFAPEAFEQRLSQLQIVLHNQDNREHDLLDSDDYYQFQGGLTAAVRSVQGHNPEVYFGDHAIPANPKVRRLQEELARVYRSRVINPKWIAGAMRHGYKGAFEMAATVDYLFAYSATTHCVENYMYQGVAEAYLLDPKVQAFVHGANPWALRDMAERLLEAHQRGLWQGVDSDVVEELRAIALQAEGVIESKTAATRVRV